MINADHPIPGLAVLDGREVQVRPGRVVERPVRALGDPFQTKEEVCLVSHDRSADRAAPLLQIALGFFQIGLPGEVVRGRDLRVGEVAEHDAPELVCALFRDGVNDRARRTAEAALLTSERKYRVLFDSNPLPMWVFDRDTLTEG